MHPGNNAVSISVMRVVFLFCFVGVVVVVHHLYLNAEYHLLIQHGQHGGFRRREDDATSERDF